MSAPICTIIAGPNGAAAIFSQDAVGRQVENQTRYDAMLCHVKGGAT